MNKGKQAKGGAPSAKGESAAKGASELITYSRKRKAAAEEGAEAKPAEKEEEPDLKKGEYDWPVSAYGSGREAARLAMQRVREQASKKGKKPGGKPSGSLQSRLSEDFATASEGPASSAENGAVQSEVDSRAAGDKQAEVAELEGARRTRASAAAVVAQGKSGASKSSQPLVTEVKSAQAKSGVSKSTQPLVNDVKPASVAEQGLSKGGESTRGLSPRLALKKCGDAKTPKSGGVTPRIATRQWESTSGGERAQADIRKEADVSKDPVQRSKPDAVGAATSVGGKLSIDVRARPGSASEKRETRQTRGQKTSPSSQSEEVVFEGELASPRQAAKGKLSVAVRVSPRGRRESTGVQTSPVVEVGDNQEKRGVEARSSSLGAPGKGELEGTEKVTTRGAPAQTPKEGMAEVKAKGGFAQTPRGAKGRFSPRAKKGVESGTEAGVTGEGQEKQGDASKKGGVAPSEKKTPVNLAVVEELGKGEDKVADQAAVKSDSEVGLGQQKKLPSAVVASELPEAIGDVAKEVGLVEDVAPVEEVGPVVEVEPVEEVGPVEGFGPGPEVVAERDPAEPVLAEPVVTEETPIESVGQETSPATETSAAPEEKGDAAIGAPGLVVDAPEGEAPKEEFEAEQVSEVLAMKGGASEGTPLTEEGSAKDGPLGTGDMFEQGGLEGSKGETEDAPEAPVAQALAGEGQADGEQPDGGAVAKLAETAKPIVEGSAVPTEPEGPGLKESDFATPGEALGVVSKEPESIAAATAGEAGRKEEPKVAGSSPLPRRHLRKRKPGSVGGPTRAPVDGATKRVVERRSAMEGPTAQLEGGDKKVGLAAGLDEESARGGQTSERSDGKEGGVAVREEGMSEVASVAARTGQSAAPEVAAEGGEGSVGGQNETGSALAGNPEGLEKEILEDEGKGKSPAPEVKARPLNPGTCPICLRTFQSAKAMYGHQRTHDTRARSKAGDAKAGWKRKEGEGGAVLRTPVKKMVKTGGDEESLGDVAPGKDAGGSLSVKREGGTTVKQTPEILPARVLKKRKVSMEPVEKKAPESTLVQGGTKPEGLKKPEGVVGRKPQGLGVNPKAKLVKKPVVSEVKAKAEVKTAAVASPGEATCPICQRVFHSAKAMYGHQRAHNTLEGFTSPAKAKPLEVKKVKKGVLGKASLAPGLLKKKPGMKEGSGQLKKLAAVLAKLKKGPKPLQKSGAGGSSLAKPKLAKPEASSDGAASAATCPICLRTFQSAKAMYGHQRTHDLDERSRLGSIGIAAKPNKMPVGLPLKKPKPGLLLKKKLTGPVPPGGLMRKKLAAPVAPGGLVRKKPPGIPLGWKKKTVPGAGLLGPKAKRSEAVPVSEPDVSEHSSDLQGGFPVQGVPGIVASEATETTAESPLHTPGGIPTCPFCQRTFKSRKALYGHQRTHGGGLAALVQRKAKVARPLSASGKKLVPAGVSTGFEAEQAWLKEGDTGSADDADAALRRRSTRLPVFEALGGTETHSLSTGTLNISRVPGSEFRGAAMQGRVCNQGRPAPPHLRAIVSADEALAASGGYSIKGIMQAPTAGSIVESCLECGAACYSEGRAWLRCQGKCGRYIHQKCTARPRMKGPPEDGITYACWDCRMCHSCGVRLLDAPEAGQHKERQYTLCPPCAKLWSMHNYCTACEKVYHDDYVGEPMVQCTVCFHWCHATCEGYSKETYATLVHNPESVFNCTRCKTGIRDPAPQPISEAEAIAEAAAEAAADKATSRKRTPGGRVSIFDAPVRKTGSLQHLLGDALPSARIPAPRPRGRPRSAPKDPDVNMLSEDETGLNRPLSSGLLRPGLPTNGPKRLRTNAAIRASKLKSSARARAVLRGREKGIDGGPPLSPTTGLLLPKGSTERDMSRTGRKLKTPARLAERNPFEGVAADQEIADWGEEEDPSASSWKKKMAASVVAAKLGQLGKVAGKRKRGEAEIATDDVIEEAELIGSLVRRLNSPLPRPTDGPARQVAFAPDTALGADAAQQKDPPNSVRVAPKQRIRHVGGEGPWCGDRRVPPQTVARFSTPALCELEACKACGGMGDRDEDDYLCCVDCGEAYHSFCLEPPLRSNAKLREFWRCPMCKLCEGCGQSEDRASMILCSHCDASYHEGCLDERSAPNDKQRKLGWICPGCSACACGTRLGTKVSSMRWFPRSDGSVVCTKCLRQKSRGHMCSLCRNTFEDPASKDIAECATCLLKVHKGCDPSHQTPKPGSSYHCPSCRKVGTPKKLTLRSAHKGKRLKGGPGTPSAHPPGSLHGSPFRNRMQPPTLIVENPSAEINPADALSLDPPTLGAGELGLTPGTMARLGLDSGFGTGSFAEEQQELEADSELAMLLRTGSDVDLASIGGGLLGSLQSPEGLAFLRTGASDAVGLEKGGEMPGGINPPGGEGPDAGGRTGQKGTGKMAAFKVPPLEVNSFVSPGASSGSPFGLLFSQRSDQVALPNFLPGQLDTPNVAGTGLWSSTPLDGGIDGAEKGGAEGLLETPRGGALTPEEKQRVRERLSQLDASTQQRLQQFLEAEKAKQEAQWAQVENFMQRHSRMQAEREGAANRPPLSPPSRANSTPSLQSLLGSPTQNAAFLALGAEQTYLRPDALDHHPLLSPPDRPISQAAATDGGASAGRPFPDPPAPWDTRSFFRDGPPFLEAAVSRATAVAQGLGNGPTRPLSPAETQERQIELAKRMATNVNAAETFLKKLPPQLAKELSDRFPEGVPPSVLSAIAQHLVRVSTQPPPSQPSPHGRNPPSLNPRTLRLDGPLGASPLSPAGVPFIPDKNALATLQMPPPTSSVRSPKLAGAQQMNVGGSGSGPLRGQAARQSPTFMAQFKRGGVEKGLGKGGWSAGFGAGMEPPAALARMAAAKRTLNQLPSPTINNQAPNQGGASGVSIPGVVPAGRSLSPFAQQSTRPVEPPSESAAPVQLTPQQMVRKAEVEQLVIQKYGDLLDNPETIQRLIQLHRGGSLPPDAGPHIAALKKLTSDQQKASGIQTKYTALILACQREALLHGDRKRAQLAIRNLQQKQEEERKKALAEQQKYIRQEASRMAQEVVAKEAASARAQKPKDSFASVFPASLFLSGGESAADPLGGLLNPDFGGALLPSPESFFAGGGFGSVEKVGGVNSALRGEAARSESPDVTANGSLAKTIQLYPRSMSPVPLIPFQQSPPGDSFLGGNLTGVTPGDLDWASRPLESSPSVKLRLEGPEETGGVGRGFGKVGPGDKNSQLDMNVEPSAHAENSIKKRKEELRAVGGLEDGCWPGVQKFRSLEEIDGKDSPVIAQLGKKVPSAAASVGFQEPGESARERIEGVPVKDGPTIHSQRKQAPVRKEVKAVSSEEGSSGSDSEDEPLILTASKRALAVGSESKVVKDAGPERGKKLMPGKSAPKVRRSLGGVLADEQLGGGGESGLVGSSAARSKEALTPRKVSLDSGDGNEPPADDEKKPKRRKGVTGEQLLLAQNARQQVTQLLKEDKDAQDQKMAELFETVGEKRVAELEEQARQKLGADQSGFANPSGLPSTGPGEKVRNGLVVGGFVVEGGSLAVSLQPPGTETGVKGAHVKVETDEGDRGEGITGMGGQKGRKRKPVDRGETDADAPRAKKQRSSHLQLRQAVRAQMPVKPSRGVDLPGGQAGVQGRGAGPAMWSEQWWLEKWKSEERAAKRDEGASSGEDVPIGQALTGKGSHGKRIGTKKKRLSHKRAAARTPIDSPPVPDSDTRSCTLCCKGAHVGGAGRLLTCGPNTWVHVNCILWAPHVPRLPSGELWFVQSVLLKAWKARCASCDGFGASVACSFVNCGERFHFPCALKEGVGFVQGGRVYCPTHATTARMKRLTAVQGDTHFAWARAFVEPWWAQDWDGGKSAQQATAGTNGFVDGNRKDGQTEGAAQQSGSKLETSEGSDPTVDVDRLTDADASVAVSDLPPVNGMAPAVMTELPAVAVALPDGAVESTEMATLASNVPGVPMDSDRTDSGHPLVGRGDGDVTMSDPQQTPIGPEREAVSASGGDAAAGPVGNGPIRTENGPIDMQVDLPVRDSVNTPPRAEPSEDVPVAETGLPWTNPGDRKPGSGPIPAAPSIEGLQNLKRLEIPRHRADSLRASSSSPRRSPGSFPSPVAGLSIVKGKRAKRSRLEDSWGAHQLVPGGSGPTRNNPPEDSEAPVGLFGGEGPHLVQFLRVGAVSVERLGEVVPNQRGFHSLTQLYPVGFRAWRVHWSTQRPNQRCLYLLEVLRTAYGPLFRITAQGEVGKRREPEGTGDVNPQMHPISGSSLDEAWANLDERIWAVRRSNGVAWTRHRRFWGAAHSRGFSPLSPRAAPLSPKPLSPHLQHQQGQGPASCGACCGAWLFGLHVADVCKRMEYLPRVEECPRYKFRHRAELVGRNVKLAECARTAEPWIRHLVERTEDDAAARVAAVKAAQRRTTALEQVVMDEPTKGPSTTHKADAIVHMPAAMQYRSMRDNLKARVRVGASDIHGKGLFAKTLILHREMVIEYVGELIRPKISDMREKQYRAQKMGCYFFGFPPSKQDHLEDLVVDATRKGNAARNINHSCGHNCVTKAVVINGVRHLIVFAIRTILPGEEITINYCFRSDPTEEKVPCLCGSVKCKGFLN